MKKKSYKNRTYREITTTETPYLNIYTGQRIFIDAEVVPPKNMFYVEDLNPYQRTISIVMATHPAKPTLQRGTSAATIYQMIRHKLEAENRSQMFSTTYTCPSWFEDLIEILYYGNYE